MVQMIQMIQMIRLIQMILCNAVIIFREPPSPHICEYIIYGTPWDLTTCYNNLFMMNMTMTLGWVKPFLIYFSGQHVSKSQEIKASASSARSRCIQFIVTRIKSLRLRLIMIKSWLLMTTLEQSHFFHCDAIAIILHYHSKFCGLIAITEPQKPTIQMRFVCHIL